MQFSIALNAFVRVKFNLTIQIKRMNMSVIFVARQLFRYDFNRVHCFIQTNITEPRTSLHCLLMQVSLKYKNLVHQNT